jgi:hypothetical protein
LWSGTRYGYSENRENPNVDINHGASPFFRRTASSGLRFNFEAWHIPSGIS